MRKLIGLAVIVLLLSIVAAGMAAADDVLEITDIVVKVNGDEESGVDSTGGSAGVPPESTMTVKVKVKNLLASGNDSNQLTDITIKGLIEAIDEDDDDLEEESDEFELNGDRDHSETLTFQIPLKLYTDKIYTMTITAEGKDDNRTLRSDEVTVDIEADKVSHELRFITKEVTPATVKAGQTAQVRIIVMNSGENDEEESVLSIEAPDFSYSTTTTFDILEDVDDSENEYAYTGTIAIPADTAAGTYPINIKVTYRDGRENIQDVLNLNVQAVATTQPTPVVVEEEPEEEETPVEETEKEPEVQVITQAPVTQYVPPASANAAVATPRTSYGSANQSWLDKNKWVVLIVVTDLVLLVIGIAVVMAVIRRRRL